MIAIIPYTPDRAEDWNTAVRRSRNGTFLFERGFMDYHADRFEDASLMFERDGRWLAVLPQVRVGDEWHSHGGLTYGGLVLAPEATVLDAIEIYDRIAEQASHSAISCQTVTPVPHIYHAYPADEERYCLARVGAVMVRGKADSVIDLRNPLPARSMRRKGERKAKRSGLSVTRIAETAELDRFHEILVYNRQSRHGVDPVHSAAEMMLLQGRFPDNIEHWAVHDTAGSLVAGAWVFLTRSCAHIQYAAYDDAGRDMNATDLLYLHLIEHYRTCKSYLAFGVSDDDRGLNEGLAWQKASFGARTILHETYRRSFDG